MATKKKNTLATTGDTGLAPDVEQAVVDTVTKPKLRYMAKFKEDLEKNPPDAPSPEAIERYIKNSGRPPMYKTAEEMQAIITDYFRSCMTEVYDAETGEHVGFKWSRRISLGDLSIHLGMRLQTLWDYSNRDEFAETIKSAKNIVENYYEKALTENRNPAGLIFILKNGFSWKDVSNVEIKPVEPLGQELPREEIINALPQIEDNSDD